MARKRFIAILLTLVMLLQLLPTVALSEEGGAVPKGYKSAESNVSEGATYYHVYFKDPNVGDSEIVAHQLVEQNTDLTVFPENRTAPTGQKFDGWYVDDQKVEPPYAITGETTIVAKYVPVETIDVQIQYLYKDKAGNIQTDKPIVETEKYSYDAADTESYTLQGPTSIEVSADQIGGEQTEKVILYPENRTITFTPSNIANATPTPDKSEAEGNVVWTFTLYYKTADAKYNVVYNVEDPASSTDEGIAYKKFFEEEREAVIGNDIYFVAPDASVFKGSETYPEAADIYAHSTFDHADSLTLTGSNDVLNVYYLLNQVKLSYDSQGGSYVEPKSVKYGQDVDVYTHEAGGMQLTCTKEEHTHSNYPWGENAKDNKGKQIGCYTSTQNDGWFGSTYWTWDLTCGIEAHTHSASCYNSTPESWDPVPTREGYTFGGWYLDPACSQEAPANFDPLKADTTVYAKWNPSTANYTIVYMSEVCPGDTEHNYYSYLSSTVTQGQVGSQVTATQGTVPSYHVLGDRTSATVAADGSTVVYCYYDLKEYTIKFDLGGNDRYIQMTENGTKYYDEAYSITAVLGEDISAKWPTVDNVYRKDNKLNTWESGNKTPWKTKIIEVTTEVLPSTWANDSITYTATWTTWSNITKVEYWLQNADDNGYTKSEDYSQSFINTAGLSAKDLYGFTKHAGTPDGYQGNETTGSGMSQTTTTYRFYYDRKTYSITYKYKDTKLKTETGIRFEKNINQAPYTNAPALAEYPEGMEDYTFEGWYSDPECGTLYKFDKMPGGDLVLYAKFKAPEYDVKFDTQGGEEYIPTQRVEKYKTVGDIPIPTRQDYDFGGWYQDAECTQPYDLNEPVTQNTTLYAKWTQQVLSYTVHYQTTVNGEAVDIRTPETSYKVDANLELEENLLVTCEAPDISGYRYAGQDRTVTINLKTDRNVYFTYVKRDKVNYTVKCIDDSTEEEIPNFQQTLEADAYTDRVTATAPSFDGYYLYGDAVESLEITGNENTNVIVFHYLPYKYVPVLKEHKYWADGKLVKVEYEPAGKGDPELLAIGDSASIEKKTGDGFEFTKYDEKRNYYVAETDDVGNGTIELVANYNLFHWYVKFEFVGDHPEGAQLPESATLWHLKDTSYTWTTPEYNVPGWKFEGWYLDENCEGEQVLSVGDPWFTGNDTVTVYGKWKRTTVDITVTKEWDDVPEGKSHPTSVQATITGGESDVDVTLDADHKWTDTRRLNAANSAGELIEYGVTEIHVNGYTTEIEKSKDGHTFTITNTYTGGKDVTLSGSKTWVMAGGKTKNDPVTLVVKRSAEGVDEETVPDNEYSVAWDNGKFTITGLKQYAPNGNAYSYTVSEADVGENGMVEIGDKTYKYEADGNNFTNTDQTPSWTVKKDVQITKGAGNTENGTAEVGDTLTYTVTVTNTGYVSLTKTLEDVFTVDGKSAADGTLEWTEGNPSEEFTLSGHGNTKTFTATYTVQATDNDLSNVATVGGESSTVKTEVEDKPAWTVDKSVAITKGADNTTEGKAEVGDTLTYTITVKNTGNCSITKTLEDTFTVNGNVTALSLTKDGTAYNGDEFTLAEGQTATFTATYTVQPTDANLSNTATVDGVSDKEETTVEDNPGLTAVKTLTNGTSVDDSGNESARKFKAGEDAQFDITVTNSGNTTQTNVTVSEMEGATILPGTGYDVVDGKAVIAEMAPGAKVVVKAKYTVKQSDIDSDDPLKNIATVKSDSNPDPAPTESEEIPKEEQKPGLSIEKTLTNTSDAPFTAGDIAGFKITVTNSGNTTLTGVVVSEQLDGATISYVADSTSGYTMGEGSKSVTIPEIAPGGVVTVYATYTVSQADVDAGGSKTNTATATSGDDIEEKATVDFVIGGTAAMIAVKRLTNSGSGANGAFKTGETATFDIVVKNVGDKTQKNVTVTEELSGAKIVDDDGYAVNADGTATITELAPGAVVTVKAEYTITQDDIDSAAKLENIATVKSDSKPEPDPTEPEEIPKEEQKPGLSIDKELTNSGSGEDGAFEAGDVAVFEITVTNSGNTTLTNVNVADQLPGAIVANVSGSTQGYQSGPMADGFEHAIIPEIAPNTSVTVTVTYTVTQADVDAGGSKTNTATAKSDQITNGPSDDAEIPIGGTAAMIAVKRLTNSGSGANGAFKAGEKATFDIVVKNVGDKTQKNVTVTEKLAGAKIVAGESYTVNADGTATITDLAPGAVVTVKAEYTITQDDIDYGTDLENTATVEGEDGTEPETPPEVDIPEEKQNPGLTTTKTLTNEGTSETTDADGKKLFKANDTATFDIVVENTGNTTQKNVTVTDTMAGAKIVPGGGYTVNDDGTATIDEIPVGESVTVKAEYTITQADIDNQTELANAATVKGEGPAPDPEPEKIPTETMAPELTVEKTASAEESPVGLGDTITYTITVTNSGNVTVSNITVTDPLTGLEQSVGTLAPGASAEAITTTYTVTEADILAGKIVNEATARGTDPDGEPVEGRDSETVKNESDPTDPDDPDKPVIEEPAPELTVEKTAVSATNSPAKLGDTITYTITVTNSGNVTVSGITVTDSLTKLEQSVGTLVPGASAEAITTTYTVTEADILAGSIENTATARGTDPDGEPVEGRDSETVKNESDPTDPDDPDKPVIEEPAPELTVEKTASAEESPVGLGDTITYTITVTNSGNVTVSDITVTDPLTGLEQSVGTLAPGASAEAITTTYTVTEADILAGEIVNEATARGTDPNHKEVTGSDSETVKNEPDPDEPNKPEIEEKRGHLTVTKETTNTPANGTAYELGETITYSVTVKNDGNLTITDIIVTDELTGDSWKIDSLAPDETSEAFKTSHVVTEADILAGSVLNVATAKGTSPDPEEPDVPVTPGEDKEPTQTSAPSLFVEKRVLNSSYGYKLGDKVRFTVHVTNNGNVTLSNVVVTDEKTDDSWTIDSLAPGASQTFTTKEYTVTEADILEGTIKNIAKATGTAPDDSRVEGEGSVSVDPEPSNPHLTITKTTTSTPENGSAYRLGETITYEITAKNDGNLTLTDVVVTDELTGDSWTVGTMAPGASETSTAEYVVTENDLGTLNEMGSVMNIADATATSPDPDTPPTIVPGKEEDPTVTKNPALSVVKALVDVIGPDRVTKGAGAKLVVGDTAEFAITVMNIGNVTLDEVHVKEDLDGATFTGQEEDGNVDHKLDINGDEVVIHNLAPEQVVILKATYTLTQEDYDLKKEIVNTLTVTGDGGNPEPDPVPVPTEPKNGKLTITKTTTSEPANGETYALGETIAYEITATNDGNLTLTDITVTDELTGDEWPIASLAPGASETFTAEYVVTEADILAGSVLNVATAKGTSPDPDEPEVPVEPGEKEDPTDPKNGHVTITKTTTSTPANGEAYVLGETIIYEITAENDGNLTITDVVVTDELTGDTWTIESLAPGASETFTTSHVVTEADILAGSVLNVATAKGTSPDPDEPDVPVDPGDTEDPTEPKDGKLTITKTTTSTPENGTAYALGETIAYEITATNDGNLTLTDVTVTDELTGDEWTIESLEPNTSKTFTAEYVVTEADVLAGSVVNVATAKGTNPDPEEPDVPVDPGEKEDPTDPKAGHLTITKTTTSTPAEGTDYALGETITYNITATNDGNLTLTDVTVTDELTGDTWTIESLEPGESETFTASHVVTEADILAGSVVNVATATGTSPDPDEPEVPVDPGEKEDPTDPKNGHLTITKTTTSRPANGRTYVLGETITYSITATNDGNLTLTDITVTDALTGNTGENAWTIESLEPGASQTFTTSHVVTEADILAGSVVNVATATGTSPDPDEPDVPVDPGEKEDPTDPKNGHLTINKTTTSTPANGATYALGETITYSITATNDGNLTLTNVVVTDALTGDSWTIPSLEPGASESFTARHAVTEADIRAGRVVNVATATGTSPDPDKPDVPVDPGEKEDRPEPRRSGLTTVKSLVNGGSGEGGAFRAGETAIFTITVENTGNTTQRNVVVTERLSGAVITAGYGYTVNSAGQAVIAELLPGESVVVDATYTVTQADVNSNRAIYNTATVSGGEGTKTGPDPVPVPHEIPVPGLSSSKTLTNSGSGENGAFKAGETATFDIVVENTGNTTQARVVVNEMPGASIVAGTGYTVSGNSAIITNMIPGAVVVVQATYTVTQADIDSDAPLQNVATVSGGGSTNPDPEPIPEEEKNPGLTTTKALTNAGTGANGAFKAGETATFDITVRNTGNTTQTNLVVTEGMSDATIIPGTGYTVNAQGQAVISSIAPGAAVVVQATYTITQEDIDTQREIVNTATVSGGSGETTDPDPVPVPEEQPNPGLTSTKVLSNAGTGANGAFRAGETAQFTITVTNTGNTTQENVVVRDTMAGATIVAGSGYTLNADGSATIAQMLPGDSVRITATYTVTQQDIETNAQLANTATVEGAGDTPEPDPAPIPHETPNPALTVAKTAPAGPYGAGDTVTYTIVVTNSGNVAVNNITVADPLTGMNQTIASLAPGASQTFTTTHRVTNAEVTAGRVVNTATATGTAPNGDPVTGEDSVEVQALQRVQLNVRYWYDAIGGTTASPTFIRHYFVGANYSVTSPRINGYTCNLPVVSGTIVRDTILNVIYTGTDYTLTITYVYEDGTTAAPTVQQTVNAGSRYSVTSPSIAGYTPNYTVVAGTMPARNVTYAVIYVPNETEILIDEYGVPLNIGNVTMNVGDCFE